MDKEWGLMIVQSTPESASRVGADGREGIIALNVTPGGAAYRAGLRNGAFIVKMNGKEIRTLDDYDSAKTSGDAVEVEVEFLQKNETKTTRLPVKKISQ